MSCNLTFTPLLCKKAEEYFEAARPFFGSRAQEIEDGLAQCSAAQQVCMKYLYGTMPISDIANYDFSLFLKYVDHALFLRETSSLTTSFTTASTPRTSSIAAAPFMTCAGPDWCSPARPAA